jgi:hypothetical protein
MAGMSLAGLPLMMKSCAPAINASTALSSPIVPETMMNGRSMPSLCRMESARGASNFGRE